MAIIVQLVQTPRPYSLLNEPVSLIEYEIGLIGGTLRLRRAGFPTIRDVYCAEPDVILSQIGKRKYAALTAYFHEQCLPYPPERDTRKITPLAYIKPALQQA